MRQHIVGHRSFFTTHAHFAVNMVQNKMYETQNKGALFLLCGIAVFQDESSLD